MGKKKPDKNYYRKGIDEKISLGIRLFVGILLIAAAFVTDAAIAYAQEYNHVVTVIMFIGLLCVVNVIFVKILNNPVPVILFMAGNIAGMLLYLFIISRFEQTGTVYMILFLVICFLAMWIMDMCLITGASLKKRIIGGFFMNIAVLIAVTLSSFSVILISLLNQ